MKYYLIKNLDHIFPDQQIVKEPQELCLIQDMVAINHGGLVCVSFFKNLLQLLLPHVYIKLLEER